MEYYAADINHCMFKDPDPTNSPGPGHRKVQAHFANVGTHATFVSGIAVGDDFNNPGTGNNRGNAWAARLVNMYVNYYATDPNMLLQLNTSASKNALSIRTAGMRISAIQHPMT